jgi:chromosome segregation ATPase
MGKDSKKKAQRAENGKDAEIVKLEAERTGIKTLLIESEQRCSRLSDENTTLKTERTGIKTLLIESEQKCSRLSDENTALKAKVDAIASTISEPPTT